MEESDKGEAAIFLENNHDYKPKRTAQHFSVCLSVNQLVGSSFFPFLTSFVS